MNKGILPKDKHDVVARALALLNAEVEKTENEVVAAKTAYNRAEYRLSILKDKVSELKSTKGFIMVLFIANKNKSFSCTNISNFTNIPMRTVEYNVNRLIKEGVLVFVGKYRYKFNNQTPK
jgi:Fic family protein